MIMQQELSIVLCLDLLGNNQILELTVDRGKQTYDPQNIIPWFTDDSAPTGKSVDHACACNKFWNFQLFLPEKSEEHQAKASLDFCELIRRVWDKMTYLLK